MVGSRGTITFGTQQDTERLELWVLIWYCVWEVCLQCFDTVGWVSERASGLLKNE